MFSNPSPLVSPYSYPAVQTEKRQWIPQNPQEIELMMKQKFQQPFQQNAMDFQNYQTNPYLELQAELANCSITVRNKIVSDPEYKMCDNTCDVLLKQMIEEVFVPQVLNTSQGRIAMEKFVGVVKQLKEKYSKEEANTAEQLQTLLNDDIVKQRMQQLAQMQTNEINIPMQSKEKE